MITTVFLDVDDTLLDFDECAKESMKISFEKYGLAFKDECFLVFIEENDKLWKDFEKGLVSFDDIYALRFKRILERLGIEYDSSLVEKSFVAELSLSHTHVEGAEDLLKYLSNNYELYVTSNAPHAEQVGRLKLAGLLPYFKDLYTSELLGVSKPDPSFFEECLKRSGKKREEAVVIGDSYSSDVRGAMNTGVNIVWFNRHNKEIPDGFKGTSVSSLTEIKGVL